MPDQNPEAMPVRRVNAHSPGPCTGEARREAGSGSSAWRSSRRGGMSDLISCPHSVRQTVPP